VGKGGREKGGPKEDKFSKVSHNLPAGDHQTPDPAKKVNNLSETLDMLMEKTLSKERPERGENGMRTNQPKTMPPGRTKDILASSDRLGTDSH